LEDQNMPGRGFADPEHRAKHANLKGRPTGIPSRLKEAMQTIDENLDDLLAKAMELALSGDVQMLGFLLGRRIPMPKPTDHVVSFPLPADIAPGDLDGLTLSVLRAISSGQLDPTSGAKLCSALTGHLHMTSTREVQNLKDEVAKLRALFQGQPATINAAAANDPAEAWPMEDGHPTSKPNGGDDG
jgi:hypothetical protein